MYDLPEVHGATDALWSGIARHLQAEGVTDVPDALERTRSIATRDPALLFGQACGYPVTHDFADALRVVATPCHTVPGCEGGLYHSVVLVADDAPFRELAEPRIVTRTQLRRRRSSRRTADGGRRSASRRRNGVEDAPCDVVVGHNGADLEPAVASGARPNVDFERTGE